MSAAWLIPLSIWAILAATWVCYIGIMAAIRVRDTLHWSVWIFLGPLAIVGITLDFTLNLLMSIAFWDLPRESLLTARLQRYRDQDQYIGTKRRSAAKFICEKWLNPFDPKGSHC